MYKTTKRLCTACNKVFTLEHEQPIKEVVCPQCAGPLLDPVASANKQVAVKAGMYSAKDVANLLRINPSTVYRKVKAGEFPQPVKLSAGVVRWRREDIEAYMAGEN